MSRRMGRGKKRRRGMALVLVLALVALTLGFSYALMRVQTVEHELNRNQSRRTDARDAAQAGIAVALRKLHDGSWNGADTTFSSALDTQGLQGFEVRYITGDGALTASSPNWQEYPFRLTIESKGYSIDPMASTSRSEYTIRVVAQLIRRKLNTNTVAASGLESFSICQTENTPARIQHPVRINGNVYLQGEVYFSREYPTLHQSVEYLAYFEDLYDMYADRGWDYRPFSGRLFTPSIRQPALGDVVQVLDAKLHVPRTSVPATSTSLAPVATSFSGYRLYDKGKLYPGTPLPTYADVSDTIPNADYIIQPGTYSSDPQLNPLGLFLCAQGRTGVTSNTRIAGFIMNHLAGDDGDLHIAGQNVTLTAHTLPALSGDGTNYRLPAVMARDDVRVYDGTNRTIEGWVLCGDEFQIRPGVSSSTITLTGGVHCKELEIEGRTSVPTGALSWTSAYTAFVGHLNPTGENAYFPGWVKNNRASWSLYLDHRLVFNPTPAGITNYVPDISQPIYVPHADDGGLVWDLVRWEDVGQ